MEKLNKTFQINPLYEADGYKVGHPLMIAPNTTKEYWTWIPRNLKYMPKGINKIMSAGQQITIRYLHSTFQENFFNKPIEVATKFTKDIAKYLMLDYNFDGFEKLHRLGYLPLKIKALPEGIFTNQNIPHMTGINTHDDFAWLGLFLETMISKLAWQSATTATIGYQFKKNAVEWVNKTDEKNLWLTDYMCHDFHSRGGNPFTSIAVGLGHAMSNRGSDTLNVIEAARYYYDELEEEVCINSVNASEHSVSCTKIFTVGEKQMIIDWLKLFPNGILSIVCDTFSTWDFIDFLKEPEIKELILNRTGKLVVRPDSGDPVDIICGLNIQEFNSLEDAIEDFEDTLSYNQVHGEMEFECDTEITVRIKNKYYILKENVEWNRHDKQYYFIEEHNTISKEINFKPEHKGVIELLWDIFGGTINEQGYKVLDSHIGAIYGDSINLERQVNIYSRLASKEFAATNIVLGVGSYTYVMLTRDSAGYAAKGAWFENNDKGINIYKDPITDDGVKKSLKGRVQVATNLDGEIVCYQECSSEEECKGMLQTIYEDGKFFNQTTLTEIRKRLI